MQDRATLEEKQHFLRAEIIESGVDPEAFMSYMGTIKDEGTFSIIQASKLFSKIGLSKSLRTS